MIRKFYPSFFAFVFCLLAQNILAQTNSVSPVRPAVTTNHPKLDLRLYKRLREGKIEDKNMPLLVKGDMNKIQTLTEKLGGVYKYGYNNISSVEVPEKNLLSFSQSEAIEKIENTSGRGMFLMDTSRIRNNIDSIHRGYLPLIDSLKGKNVVIGIIDGGIYWQHFDFKKPTDSTTRIKYIWDQVATGTGTIPTPYNYGRQWTETEINNNTCTHVPPANDFGHGTCVAGIAAGNSLSTKGTAYEGQLTGVAPEADIIAVRVNNSNFQTAVADAVDYIFKKADSLGKPCVINTSIGDYYGSHDGKDLTTQLIDALITAKNGRVLVAAAGNGGNVPFHVGYTLPGADSAYTLFNYSNPFGGVYFDFWADTIDFSSNAYFAIGCNSSTGTDLGRTVYYSIPTILGLGGEVHPTVNGVVVDIYVTRYDSRYQVEILPNTSNNTLLWRLQTTGTGKFDCWATSTLIGTSDVVNTLNSVYIADPKYRHSDYNKTMVSGWQNSDKVITVGNYSNRASYLDYYGNTVNLLQSPYNEVVGQRFATSSWGPTRDNRVKPDVMASGSTTICTGDANFITAAIPSNSFKISVTRKHIRNGGTSMASPVVAGIAALYLQKYPHASYSEIKQALICTAKSDAFTGTTPNNEYGNGKVDGFAAIAHSCIIYGNNTDTACLYHNPLANTDTGCVAKVYGVMDTGCFNYNPLANVDGGVCNAKIYGVMDTACINYNPLANIDGGTCTAKVYGVMDTACINYNPNANVSGGTCNAKVYGIMDTACLNYNPLANTSGGVCDAKIYGIMDTACINYNPNANISGGTCENKVYGIMDTSCQNYNPLANISGGTCIPTAISDLREENIWVQVMPNPFNSQTTFVLNSLHFKSGSIKIFNQVGELMDEIKLAEGKFLYVYNNNKLAKGIYNYMLQTEERKAKAGKLVVE